MIKFRAWHYEKGNPMYEPYMRYSEEEAYGLRRFFYSVEHEPCSVEVMQFTGIKDMEGKDIYAGDIVLFTYWWFDGNIAESNLTGTIIYQDSCMSFQLKGVKNKEWQQFTGYENDTDYLTPFSELNFEEADFKIIGNICENPELLGEL